MPPATNNEIIDLLSSSDDEFQVLLTVPPEKKQTPPAPVNKRPQFPTKRPVKSARRARNSPLIANSMNPFSSQNSRANPPSSISRDLPGSSKESAIPLDASSDDDSTSRRRKLPLKLSSRVNVAPSKSLSTIDMTLSSSDDDDSDQSVTSFRKFVSPSRSRVTAAPTPNRIAAREERRKRNNMGALSKAGLETPKDKPSRQFSCDSDDRKPAALPMKRPPVHSLRVPPKGGRSARALQKSSSPILSNQESPDLIKAGRHGKHSRDPNVQMAGSMNAAREPPAARWPAVPVKRRPEMATKIKEDHKKVLEVNSKSDVLKDKATSYPITGGKRTMGDNSQAPSDSLTDRLEEGTEEKTPRIANLHSATPLPYPGNGENPNNFEPRGDSQAMSDPVSAGIQVLPEVEVPKQVSEVAMTSTTPKVQPKTVLPLSHLFAFDRKPSSKLDRRKLSLDPPAVTHHEPRCSLNFVRHLEKRGLTKQDLPFWSFFVTADDDKRLFNFRVEARQSSIPNSGMGLFIKLVEAYDLKKSARKRWISVNKKFLLDTSTLGDDLQICSCSGMMANLEFEGSFLEEKRRRLYIPKTMPDLKAIVDGKMMRVRITGDDTHYEPAEEPIPEGIGFYGLFRKGVDYTVSGNPVFPPGLGSIDLGQYGPFRDEDRKQEPMFTLKNWIMSSSPSEWPFDVDEKLFNKIQIVDITDDATGTPHDTARKNVPMYVNEIGHSEKLKQNVFIKEDGLRSVKYHFETKTSLEKGKWIELLTNYGLAYESTREKQGYGWKNINFGVPSSSSSVSSRIFRGLEDRHDVLNVLDDMSFAELYESLLFLEENIWAPILDAKGEAVDCEKDPRLRRVHWLVSHLRTIFLHVKKQPRQDNRKYPFQQMASMAITKCDTMQSRISSLPANPSKLTDDINACEYEQIEELCLDVVDIECLISEEEVTIVKEKLVHPFDSSIWCPIAQILTRKLFATLNQVGKQDIQSLYKGFLDCARDAATEIRASNFEKLMFTSGLCKWYKLPSSLEECMLKISTKDALFAGHSTVPKAFLASMAEKVAYLESLALGNMEPGLGCTGIKFDDTEKFLMSLPVEHDGSGSNAPLMCIPRSQSSMVRSRARPHIPWYITWQVVYVAHIFSATYLNDEVYSLESLCATVEVDVTIVKDSLAQGMLVYPSTAFMEERRSTSPRMRRPRNKQKFEKNGTVNSSRGGKQPSAVMIWEGPADDALPDFPNWSEGWTKRVFKRQSGATKGGTDAYWYTPIENFKLRSISEIKRFLPRLARSSGDERKAWQLHRQGGR